MRSHSCIVERKIERHVFSSYVPWRVSVMIRWVSKVSYDPYLLNNYRERLSRWALFAQRRDNVEDIEQQSYFAEVPQGLAKSCDTLFLLDDGTKLPVHATILARSSKLFSGILDEGPLAAASRNYIVVVPVTECTESVAKRLLSIIYTLDQQKYIPDWSISNNLALASLAHKLNIKADSFHHPYCLSCHIIAGLLRRYLRWDHLGTDMSTSYDCGVLPRCVMSIYQTVPASTPMWKPSPGRCDLAGLSVGSPTYKLHCWQHHADHDDRDNHLSGHGSMPSACQWLQPAAYDLILSRLAEACSCTSVQPSLF